MTTERVTLNVGWTGFQGGNGDDAAATTDLNNILDAVDVPIVVVRRDFMIACFNKAAGDVLGLSPSDIGRAPRDISVLAGVPRLEEQCGQTIASGVESRADFRDGNKWLVVRISPYTTGARQVTGAVLTFTNVTVFRASIDQAIYEREFTKAILNTVADPLVVLSADQRIQSGNRAFYTMFGVSRDETQGVPIYELGNGACELAPLRTQLKEMLAGSDAFQPVEIDHASPGLGQKTLMLDARPLSLPGHSERRVLVTFQDVTARKQAEAAERKRAQEKLRHTEAFLAEAQRLSSTGSFSWRAATDEITWSQQLYRIFEFELGVPVTLELIGSRVHPEDVPLFNEMIDRARGAGSDFEHEHRLQMRDHSVKYLHLVAHATRDQEGRLEYIGAVQDVTQRRLSEEALGKARLDLAHVARVTSLGALTASIAHEVNQPIGAARNNAHAALRFLAGDPPDLAEVREALECVVNDTYRAGDIVGRIRDQVKKVPPRMEGVELNDAIEEVIALVRGELSKHRVSVQMQLAEGLSPVHGDRVQLQQVMLNLILNAIEAIISVDDEVRELVISTESSPSEGLLVAVEDSGPGVAPENRERIFESFYTTKASGVGIGLSICRSIIDAHGGRLWADAHQPRGAVFRFTLPAHN
ncbi:MAG TPA: ATP-binding protein [Casimicrobiaceae bacterium]|jgi:PAS domain S-box-containing protein|nr:ATP-binding protein [Casimicrobiaceae bacterium]